MSLSVLTIVKNRAGHLAQLVEGLRRSVVQPAELIIVDMASAPAVTLPDTAFPTTIVSISSGRLPLAAARNAAAQAATCDNLLFLDVDCIPMRDLVGVMDDQLRRINGLICAEAFYLSAADARGDWIQDELLAVARPHPVRHFPTSGMREEGNAGLFWSLVFGIRRTQFDRLGGFDEAFSGYGAEDTDFGFRAKGAGIPLFFMGGPGAFHQHHEVFDPPLQHIEDILRNAHLFFDRWKIWPMEGWLQAFAEAGLICRDECQIELVRLPTADEVAGARRLAAF